MIMIYDDMLESLDGKKNVTEKNVPSNKKINGIERKHIKHQNKIVNHRINNLRLLPLILTPQVVPYCYL